jgi:hypothetical protein
MEMDALRHRTSAPEPSAVLGRREQPSESPCTPPRMVVAVGRLSLSLSLCNGPRSQPPERHLARHRAGHDSHEPISN